MGQITVNGVTFSFRDGSNVSINGNKVVVDGKPLEGLEGFEAVTIEVHGDVNNIRSDNNVIVHGNVLGFVDAGNNIVANDIRNGASAGNNIRAEAIHGDTTAGNNIHYNKK